MSFLAKIATQILTYGVTTVVGRLLNYILGVTIFTWILSTEEFGYYTDLYSLITFVLVFFGLGLETAYFRFHTSKNAKEIIFTMLLISASIFLSLGIIFQHQISDFFSYPPNANYFLLLAIIAFFDILLIVPFASLRLQEKAKTFAVIKLFSIVLNIGLNILFLIILPRFNILTGSDRISLILVANLVSSIGAFIFLIPTINFRKLQLSGKFLKGVFAFSLPLLVAAFLGMINENFDKLTIDDFVAGTPNFKRAVQGIYGANYKLSILLLVFFQAYRYTIEPFFFRNTGQDQKARLVLLMKYFVIVSCLVVVFVTAFLENIKFIVAEEYRVGVYIVPVLLFANMFMGINYNLSVFYKVSSKTYLGTLIFLVGSVLTVGLNAVLVPKFTILGAAVATLSCYFSMMIISFVLSRKYYLVSYNIKNALLHIFLALAFVILARTLVTPSFTKNFLIGAGMMFGYLLLVLTFEKKNVMKLLRNVKGGRN